MKTRLRKKDVCKIMHWSASTLNLRVSSGSFIKPTYEGKTPYWLSTDVEQVVTEFFGEADHNNHPIVAS